MQADGGHGVQAGEYNVQYNNTYVGGRGVVAWPHRVGVVPPVVDCRQPRPADALLAVAADTGGGGTAVVCQVLAGLGGVGKTQLAAYLAHHWWQQQRLDLLLWVTAASRTGIVTGFARAAQDVTGVDDSDAEHGAERLLAWLAGTDRSWLIVLDDLTDPGDLAGLWPPDTRTGRTVVTTRRRDAALLAGRHVIDVDLFTAEQAAAYLTAKLATAPLLGDDVAGLAADLGHLPLALAQAVAYLLDRNVTCTEYRHRLATKHLRQLRPLSLPDQHRAIVAATWQVSIDLADQLTPPGIAGHLLAIAALLDPNGIPTDLFTTTAVRDGCTSHLGAPVDSDDIRDAVHVLHRLSLATINAATTTLRVHALVQRAVRDATNPDHHTTLATTTADALLELWPAPERDATHAQPLRANTAALHANTGRRLWHPTDGGHTVLFQAGASLGQTGLVTDAATYYQHLHTTAVEHLGPDHPDTLTTRGNLALWRGEAGDAAGAAAAFQQLLTDRLRVLGPDHPATLTTRGNLALWRGEAGDPAGAATAFQQLLTDSLRVLGPDHPDTLTTRGNLAHWRGHAGDAAGAAAAFQQLLTDRLRVLGPDHPDTLTTRNNLAHWRGHAGDAAGAATAFQQLLTDYLRVLGPDHPETLTTCGNLAYWQDAASASAPEPEVSNGTS